MSPEMCTLSITDPNGKEIANLSIKKGSGKNERYVQQNFTHIVNDTIYTTNISANEISLSEGTVSSVGGVLIKKRFIITADGLKDSPL